MFYICRSGKTWIWSSFDDIITINRHTKWIPLSNNPADLQRPSNMFRWKDSEQSSAFLICFKIILNANKQTNCWSNIFRNDIKGVLHIFHPLCGSFIHLVQPILKLLSYRILKKYINVLLFITIWWKLKIDDL